MAVSTAWMWQEGVHTRGVNLEMDQQCLLWHEDLVGFSCALAPREQPLADFIANGPGRYASPPDEILEEIQDSIVQLSAN